jgi:hypothetical protein
MLCQGGSNHAVHQVSSALLGTVWQLALLGLFAALWLLFVQYQVAGRQGVMLLWMKCMLCG